MIQHQLRVTNFNHLIRVEIRVDYKGLQTLLNEKGGLAVRDYYDISNTMNGQLQ